MKSPMYMSSIELIETFGVGKVGSRRVTSDMVRWLLTDPPEHLLKAAFIHKAPTVDYIQPIPKSSIQILPQFDFGDFYDPSTD